MAMSFSTASREVLEQVVREPRFRALTQIPLLAPMEIGLVIACYSLFALSSWMYLNGNLPMPLMFLINGVAIYAVFTPLHDATHRTVSCNRMVNDLIGTIACGLLLPGITTGIYRYLHLEHHRYAGDRVRDPDEPFVSAKSWRSIAVTAGLDVLWTTWYLRQWSTRPRAEQVEFIGCITFYIGFHAAFLLSPWALEFFLVFMIPQRIGLFLVAWFFARIQHPEDVLWEEAPFQTTVQIACSRLGDIVMLGQTRHCLHHFAPSVPYYRYHRAWEYGRERFESQGVPTRTLWSPSRDLVVPERQESERADSERFVATVERVQQVASDVKAYDLVPGDDQAWPAFTAGAHIDVEMSDKLVRQYSLCNPQSESQRYRIAVRHDPNGKGGSDFMHTTIKPGDRIRIGTPRNNFPLHEERDDYVLIAGGIGVTPLLSMAYRLHEIGKSFELHQCARSAGALAFRDEHADLPFADSMHVWLDDTDYERRFDAASAIGKYRQGRALYVCGPSGFMSMVMSRARELGWPQEAMVSETFVPPRMDASNNESFEVELARSGDVLNVGADEFLIDVLHANGHYVMCSCTQGICGSCMTPVLEGEPDHRDAIMTDDERAANNQMTVCVSRAKSKRLVLDI